ncbi:hypothetical protein T492DRAFT_914206 [Pavlovales sp. CCMP2436]|nr:hypothetical protein T492DRAFT_914206 [Pavlovales sp. CCMP2436]
MTTTMRYPPRYPSMIPAISRESLHEPLQPRDGVGAARARRMALTVVGTAVVTVLACWAVTPRHGPAPAALAVVGFFGDTAAPWIKALFPHKAGGHGPVLSAAVPNSLDAFIPEPPPSCPIGKVEDAYHLNAERGMCQQVCISRGLRGVFIAHGGVIGGYCVELGFEEYIGEGKRSGIKFYIYAPVEGSQPALPAAMTWEAAKQQQPSISSRPQAQPQSLRPAPSPAAAPASPRQSGSQSGSGEVAAARDVREVEATRVQRDGERDAAREKAQAERENAQAEKDAAYNAQQADREAVQAERDAASRAALAERVAAAHAALAEKEAAAYKVQAEKDAAQAQKDAAYNAAKLDKEKAKAAAQAEKEAAMIAAVASLNSRYERHAAKGGGGGVETGAENGGPGPVNEADPPDAFLLLGAGAVAAACALIVGATLGVWAVTRAVKLEMERTAGLPMYSGAPSAGLANEWSRGLQVGNGAWISPGRTRGLNYRAPPTRLPIQGKVVQLITEHDTAVVLTEDGAVYTWSVPPLRATPRPAPSIKDCSPNNNSGTLEFWPTAPSNTRAPDVYLDCAPESTESRFSPMSSNTTPVFSPVLQRPVSLARLPEDKPTDRYTTSRFTDYASSAQGSPGAALIESGYFRDGVISEPPSPPFAEDNESCDEAACVSADEGNDGSYASGLGGFLDDRVFRRTFSSAIAATAGSAEEDLAVVTIEAETVSGAVGSAAGLVVRLATGSAAETAVILVARSQVGSEAGLEAGSRLSSRVPSWWGKERAAADPAAAEQREESNPAEEVGPAEADVLEEAGALLEVPGAEAAKELVAKEPVAVASWWGGKEVPAADKELVAVLEAVKETDAVSGSTLPVCSPTACATGSVTTFAYEPGVTPPIPAHVVSARLLEQMQSTGHYSAPCSTPDTSPQLFASPAPFVLLAGSAPGFSALFSPVPVPIMSDRPVAVVSNRMREQLESTGHYVPSLQLSRARSSPLNSPTASDSDFSNLFSPGLESTSNALLDGSPPPPPRLAPPGRYSNIPSRLSSRANSVMSDLELAPSGIPRMADPSSLEDANNKDVKNCYSRATTAPVLLGVSVAPGRSPPVPSRLSPPGRYPNIPSRLAPLGRPPLGLSPPTSYETSNGLPRGLSPPGRYPNIPSRLSPRGLSPPGVAPGRSPPLRPALSTGERSPSAAWLDAKVVAPTVAPPAERSGRWGLRWSSIRQSS